MRSVALVLLVAVLALGATSCGGDGDSSAEEWVDSFCLAVVEWQTEMDRITDEFGDPSSLSEDRVRELADEADQATTDLVETVRDLGAPDTESGDEIEQSMNEFADTVDAERAEIEETVDAVDSITDVPGAITTVAASLGAMTAALGEVLSTLGSTEADEELRTAFEESEACDSLRD